MNVDVVEDRRTDRQRNRHRDWNKEMPLFCGYENDVVFLSFCLSFKKERYRRLSQFILILPSSFLLLLRILSTYLPWGKTSLVFVFVFVFVSLRVRVCVCFSSGSSLCLSIYSFFSVLFVHLFTFVCV